MKDGKTRWECTLQQAYAGHRSIRPRTVRKENGDLTRGLMEMLQRWQQHFSKLLNQQVEFN